MPRYYRRRGRFRRRKRGAGRSRALLNPNYSIRDLWKNISYIKGLINSEMLYKDTTISGSSVDSSGIVQNLTGIAEGDTPSGRTGNSVFVRHIYLRGTATIASTLKPTYMRVLLVQDLQQISDSSPTIESVLQGVSITSPLDMVTNQGRFKVLYNRVFSLDVAKKQTVTFGCYKTMRVHTKFNGSGSGDIQKNGFYLMIFSDQASAADAPIVSTYSRLRYHDN